MAENQERDPVEAQPRWAHTERHIIFFRGRIIHHLDDGTGMYQGQEILPYRERIGNARLRFSFALDAEYGKLDTTYYLNNNANTTNNINLALLRYTDLREKEIASPPTITADEQTELDGIRRINQLRNNIEKIRFLVANLIQQSCSIEELSRIEVDFTQGTAVLAESRATSRVQGSTTFQLGDSDRLIEAENFTAGSIGYDQTDTDLPILPEEAPNPG